MHRDYSHKVAPQYRADSSSRKKSTPLTTTSEVRKKSQKLNKNNFFLEFCKAMDVKKRQAFEHELRRLRREGDEIISLHAQQIRTTKTQDL